MLINVLLIKKSVLENQTAFENDMYDVLCYRKHRDVIFILTFSGEVQKHKEERPVIALRGFGRNGECKFDDKKSLGTMDGVICAFLIGVCK